MHAVHLPSSIFAWLHTLSDRPHTVLQKRPIDEAGPNIQNIDQIIRKAPEAPRLVGVHNQGTVFCAKPMIKIDHTAYKFWLESADTAIIEKIDTGGPSFFLEDRVIAKMRIAMNYGVMAEGIPPRPEHGAGN